MAILDWVVRCTPGLSVLFLLLLVECALQLVQTVYLAVIYPTQLFSRIDRVFAQAIFLTYSVCLHLLALAFPLRLCRAFWRASIAIENANKSKVEEKDVSESLLRSTSPTNRATGYQMHEEKIGHEGSVQCIMLPSYKEDIGVLEETLKVLASHTGALTTYDVFLAMESRDPNGSDTAQKLVSSFRHRFRDMQYTSHPAGLPGEAAGKSSNIRWAAQRVQKKYLSTPLWRDALCTVMDSDTHLQSRYFELVRARHMERRKNGAVADMTLYMPPIVFDRNAHLIPPLVRVADLLWCGAGLSMYEDKPGSNTVAIPTAVYTVTLPLVHLVQGWDADAGAIGEDLHMMLKCYFTTNGKLTVESIPSPASQCNISSSKNGIRGWIDSHRARYTQGLRHMWGCLDTGFAIKKWSRLGTARHPRSARARKLSHTELELKLTQYQLHGDEGSKLTWRNAKLFTRIFEAHFLPTHLTIILLASTIYTIFTPPITHCRLLTITLDFTGTCRAISFVLMILAFSVFYERYHAACVRTREEAMKRAGLWEEMQGTFSYRRRNLKTFFDYIIFPVAGMIFGSVPAIHAAFAHFYTDRLTYTVSEKPKTERKGAPVITMENV